MVYVCTAVCGTTNVVWLFSRSRTKVGCGVLYPTGGLSNRLFPHQDVCDEGRGKYLKVVVEAAMAMRVVAL